MADEDNSTSIKVDEIKSQNTTDLKTNGENPEKVVTKSPVKQSPIKQTSEASKEIQSERHKEEEIRDKDKMEDQNVEEEEDEESDSDEELPLGSLEGPVQILEGKRERKKVERLSLEQKETTEKKKFEIVDGQGTKLGEMERVEMILGKTNADQLKLFYRFLFGKTGKLTEIKKHIRLFSGFNFIEDDSEYNKKEQYLVRLTMTALRDFCSYLDLERGGNKEIVMKRIMDFCLNPTPSGKKIPKKKKAQKRKRLSSGKEKAEKKPKKQKKEKPAKTAEVVDDGDVSDISSISSISSDSEDEEKPTEIKKPEKAAKKVDSEDEEEVKSPKKKKAKEMPKKPTTPKKKEKVEKKKPKEEKKKSPKKLETPKKSASPKKAKKVKKKEVVSSDSDSSDSEPIIKKKKAPTDSELKIKIETLLENANLEEITMKAFCKQVYAEYPDFDLKHKKEFIKTTVKTIVS
ncbi:protein DEK-like [Antedon mediterranea]|uniref:protein DEK-like n=1 Tax=Antedon mediterranea TaxID=105859 RepID=UPI003AF6D3AD